MDKDTNFIHKGTIEFVNSKLRGVSVVNNTPIEIPYSLPGDTYHVTFFKKKRRKPSVKSDLIFRTPRTVIPPCPAFTKCGGCSGQHISYEEQFHYKTATLLRSYQKDFGIEPVLYPALKKLHYRNRMDFAVFPGPVIGQREAGSFRYIVDLESCLIQSEESNAELKRFRSMISEFPDLPYDRKSDSGFLKYLTLRKAKNSSELMTILTFAEEFKNSDQEKEFAKACLKYLKADHILFCFNRRKGEISAIGDVNVLKGKDSYLEFVSGKEFRVPFDSFFQPNPEGFQPILDFIEKEIPKSSDHLIDLFCGSGFFSRIFAHRFRKITGIDSVESSLEIARKQISFDFPEIEFSYLKEDLFSKKSSPRLNDLLQSREKNVLIADPPRAGLGEFVTEALKNSTTSSFFYVSCNPTSQKEDLWKLKDFFRIQKILITDPYPQTPHLESVALLSSRSI
ncbi:class I SAM-dependent RNA methyltransferase [Leptospira santarosai]|uniref:class I SAM-dependent RNA methyltransferase n=1 Tax=Leptospira santarosai TaxID=28183 RepID=UPI0002BEBA36|nr:DNA adenine methylase [Leptospira santarosai]EMJ47271.1 putative 23S rRNA (uracil-5-)-methyltransferase RumA [Leptospira santarosai str. HAI1349]EMO22986.1 putative 23S rRNA (uracil-5-)-methyltransferase RumA [Leptospira santarosai str. HAI134]EMP80846.1 putative 23S rRNA (uracil-5-)-methyltransferase RumA [Leptospira santarosai str. CBC1531]MDI7182242.1 DNA adenine methylase [Leptospira santarosai]